MDVEAAPPLEESEQRALLLALEQAGVRSPGDDPYRRPWRAAAFAEAAAGDEAEVGYAFSPRSTRGATRA